MASRREGIKVSDEQQKTSESIMKNVDNISDTIKELSDNLVRKYCKDLNILMLNIQGFIKANNITDEFLETAILDLANILYFTGSAQEDLGIKEDICKSIRQEVYSKAREQATGKTNQVKLNQLSVERNECDSITTARNIEEQIAQLYVQIAYVKENVGVQKATLEAAIVNENRGKEMLEVGKMSKADLMQLTAQRAQDEYNVVQAESEVRNYKRQLKQLLQITDTEEFDIAGFEASDEMALADIPALQSVYDNALRNRPEFKSLALQVESSELSKKIAKAQGLPTIGLTASAGTNTTSLGDQSWGIQAKQNFSLGGGLSISVPIIDQRQKRTAVNKAEISRQQALLDIKDKQVELYSTIENYWIQAENKQSQYKAAKVSTESAQTSYDLLSEQFRLGLKNIVELQEGKNRLLSAQQSELQSKYMAILNIKMLDFYQK